MASATDVGIPEDIRDVVKGAVTGMLQFVDAEVVPMEEEYRPILTDERRFFHENGRAVDEVLDARRTVRMKAASAGYYGMFAPESVGGGGIGVRVMVFVEEGLYRRYGPGRPLITWAKGFLTQPVLASFVDGPSHMYAQVNETVLTEKQLDAWLKKIETADLVVGGVLIPGAKAPKLIRLHHVRDEVIAA